MRRGILAFTLSLLTLCLAACREDGTVVVHSLDFVGVDAVSANRLRDALATRQSSKLPWSKKDYFDRTRFDEDLKRIQAFYSDRGYPDAKVTGFDVKLNDKQDAVDITLTIVEGEPMRVAAVEFTGFDMLPPEHLMSLKEQAPLKVGEPRDRQLVITTRELALNELRDHGYPYGRVTSNEVDGSDGKTTSVTFAAEPGKIAYFGPIQIQGNQAVSTRVIERELSFKPGDLYRRSLAQESQRRLYGLELFQFVNIEPVNQETQPTDLPTRVTVAEGRHQRVNFGVGYGTEEKARVDGEYHHVNFLGGARSAGVHARWSSLDRGVRLDFTQPYFFVPHFSMGGEAQQWYSFTPAYQSQVKGVKATFTHLANTRTSWDVTITSEHDVSTISDEALNDPTLHDDLIALGLDPTTGEQNGTINGFGFDFQHSTADSILNPTRGFQVSLHAEQAGGFMPGSFNFTSMAADGRHYLPLGERFVVASRLQLANIRPFDNDAANVPFSKKYFLGGATSIRGWGRYEVSPLGGEGLPIGGNSLLAFSGELRSGLAGSLGGVLFLDGGNVWADSWAMDLSDLRYAAGAGLRYRTPIGPVRFDFGYQLNPIPELQVNGAEQTRRWRMHFSIGQAF